MGVEKTGLDGPASIVHNFGQPLPLSIAEGSSDLDGPTVRWNLRRLHVFIIMLFCLYHKTEGRVDWKEKLPLANLGQLFDFQQTHFHLFCSAPSTHTPTANPALSLPSEVRSKYSANRGVSCNIFVPLQGAPFLDTFKDKCLNSCNYKGQLRENEKYCVGWSHKLGCPPKGRGHSW